MKKIIVTGGAGYIGSHFCKLASFLGYQILVIDNLSTGFERLVRWGDLENFDIRDTNRLTQVFNLFKPSSVIHFAASAYVGDSIEKPLEYYGNNLIGMHSLLTACIASGVNKIVFSSSCATYGIPDSLPLVESSPTNPISPYGDTKLACERLLNWCNQAHGINYAALRYFNAAGADLESEIGELHQPETHLIPLILQCASGRRPIFDIYGLDYPTKDGSAIRDYVHVSDLAHAHILAINYLHAGGKSDIFNLGLGHGYSVLEIVRSIERVTGKSLQYKICDRRIGDPPELYADSTLARERLKWHPKHVYLDDIVNSAWNWELKCSQDL